LGKEEVDWERIRKRRRRKKSTIGGREDGD